jgi:hypothetical protein
MFSLWFILFGDSFVILDVSPSILFLVFPFFGCFGLFMIDKVSSFQTQEWFQKPYNSE